MDLLDFILHPYTAWRYRKWKRQLDEKLRQAERDVNYWMMCGRKISYSQEEIRQRIKETARALRKMETPSLWSRIKRFLRA